MNKPRDKRRSNKLYKRFTPEGTLSSPSLSLCLELVAKIFYRHMLLRDGCVGNRRNKDWEEKFDIDNFLTKRYVTVMPFCPVLLGPVTYTQRQYRSSVPLPTLEHVHKFLKFIFTKLHLNVESSIVALIYAERLMTKRKISMTPRNWRPIVIASILTASKVWDDLASWNIEFANLLPLLQLVAINRLEGTYLCALEYDLYITSSEYAKYYFALRGLKNTRTERIPRYYLDMRLSTASQSNNGNANPIDEKLSSNINSNGSLNLQGFTHSDTTVKSKISRNKPNLEVRAQRVQLSAVQSVSVEPTKRKKAKRRTGTDRYTPERKYPEEMQISESPSLKTPPDNIQTDDKQSQRQSLQRQSLVGGDAADEMESKINELQQPLLNGRNTYSLINEGDMSLTTTAEDHPSDLKQTRAPYIPRQGGIISVVRTEEDSRGVNSVSTIVSENIHIRHPKQLKDNKLPNIMPLSLPDRMLNHGGTAK